MAPDIKRWMWWASLVLPAWASGCGGESGDDSSTPDETDPPTLQNAELVDGRTLRLTFSEAMADPATVSTAAFRLSLGLFYDGVTVYYGLAYDFGDVDPDPSGGGYDDGGPPGDGDGDGATSYDDPTGYDVGDGYDDGYDGGYAQPSPMPALARPIPPMRRDDVAVASITAVADNDRQIDLGLATGVHQTDTCNAIVELHAYGMEAAIFLHYRRLPKNGLADLAGNPLASIAEHWVVRSEQSYVEIDGRYPNLMPYLPIDCP